MMWSWLIGKASSLLLGKSSLWKWVAIGVGAVAIVILILWLLWSRAEYKAEVAQKQVYITALEAANQSHLATLDAKHKQEVASAEAEKQRTEEHNRIVAERNKFQRALKEALQHEENRRWADTPVPADIRRLFQ